GNVVGNCLNRVLKMVGKYRDEKVPALSATGPEDEIITRPLEALPGQLAGAYERMELQRAALIPVEMARACNAYIDATQPFKLAKDESQSARLDTVLALATRGIYAALVGLLPVLPEKAKAGLEQLGVQTDGRT